MDKTPEPIGTGSRTLVDEIGGGGRLARGVRTLQSPLLGPKDGVLGL